MAVFTKALSNKWTPTVARSPVDSKDGPLGQRPANSAFGFADRTGDELWESGTWKEFDVTLLGRISNPFPLICSSSENPIDVQLVDVVEEAQLKGMIPVSASASSGIRGGRFGSNPTSSELSRPRPVKLALSIHGVKITDTSQSAMRPNNTVHHRQALHTILSAVSFHGQEETFIVLGVQPDSTSNSPPYGGGGGEGVSTVGCIGATDDSLGLVSPQGMSCSTDVILACCLVFQANSASDAAAFVRDMKDVFVAAMRP